MSALAHIATAELEMLVKVLATELENREPMTPDTYTVSNKLTVAYNGTVTKNSEEEYTPTVKIAHKAAMALLVRYCGVTGDAALHALERAMRDSLAADEKSEDYIIALADLKKAEKKVLASLAKLPKAKRQGKTIIKVGDVTVSTDSDEE